MERGRQEENKEVNEEKELVTGGGGKRMKRMKRMRRMRREMKAYDLKHNYKENQHSFFEV